MPYRNDHRSKKIIGSKPSVVILEASFRHPRILWLATPAILCALLLMSQTPAWGIDDVIHIAQAVGGWGIITAPKAEVGGVAFLFGLCLVTTCYGLRLLIRGLKTRRP